MSPWVWWAWAVPVAAAAVWASVSGPPWAAAAAWVAVAALGLAGLRERTWREAVRRAAQRVRDGRPVEGNDRDVADLAAAVESRLRDLREGWEEARREARRLREVVDGLPWGVVLVDGGRRVVWMNRSAGVVLGVLPEQAQDLSAVAVFRRHEVDELLERAYQRGEAARDFEGTAVLRVVARWLPEDGWLVVVQDVTQQRRAEAVRRDFVANVSHELRTPLASLRAMAETLRDGGLEDRQLAARFLDQILQEVGRMSRLVNDLLDLSALEAGVVRLRWEELQAEALLGAVARRYEPLASRKGVSLKVRPGDAQVWGDRERLEQALGNLVDNAVKYTPPGGRVELAVESRGGEVHLVVEDTGPGIPPEHLPRVFERFYRADPARTRAQGGTGLGLAITKHVALAHGGRVEAANRPGGGARFEVVLPSCPRS